MSRNSFFAAALLLMLIDNADAQNVVPSVSNTLRYGSGERGFGTLAAPFSYFENWTDVRLQFPPQLSIGFRLLADAPPEIGDRFRGLHRRFVEFRHDGISIRAGNFNELFGRGLAMHLFENRGLAYDSWMDGVKGEYSSSIVSATILGGTLRFRDSVTVARYEEYDVRAANIELRPAKRFTVGLSFVEAKGEIPHTVGRSSIAAEIPEIYASFIAGPVRGFLGYAHKWTDVRTSTVSHRGDAVTASIAYARTGFGLTAEYKDYRFDIVDPIERPGAGERATRMLPFQNGPIVQKEHNYTLLTRALHQVDFNDEVGFQIDGFISVAEGTMVNFNGSVASRHHFYDLSSVSFAFSERKRQRAFLPSFDRRLSPYWELFAEAEHYLDEKTAVRAGVARRANILYNDFTGAQFSHTQQSTVVPVQLQYAVSGNYSVIVQSENEFSYDSYNTTNEQYYTQLLTLIVTRSPDLSATLRYEMTTDGADPSGRKNWMVGELGVTVGQSHTATLSYGTERGGQVCSNGVCQYQLPFDGVRFTLRSQL